MAFILREPAPDARLAGPAALIMALVIEPPGSGKSDRLASERVALPHPAVWSRRFFLMPHADGGFFFRIGGGRQPSPSPVRGVRPTWQAQLDALIQLTRRGGAHKLFARSRRCFSSRGPSAACSHRAVHPGGTPAAEPGALAASSSSGRGRPGPHPAPTRANGGADAQIPVLRPDCGALAAVCRFRLR